MFEFPIGVVTHTPVWVWVLFIFLISRGKQVNLALCLTTIGIRDRHDMPVSHLLQFVDDNQTVESHAIHAGMSVRTFNRRFSAQTGMNFVNWRQLARVMRAMEWLAAGKPVGWIALSCGYSSVSAFIEVFRAWAGKTPGQWAIKEGPFGRR